MIKKIFVIEGERDQAGLITFINSQAYETREEAEIAMQKRKSTKCKYSVVEFTRAACVILACLSLTACATPVTQLKAKDGTTVTCGGSRAGSLSGGLLGYAINKSMDEECVKKAKAAGAR